jgi:hypothetical protein
MDFRYIIILISGLFFYTFINELTEPITGMFNAFVFLSYGVVGFFIFPLILDRNLR